MHSIHRPRQLLRAVHHSKPHAGTAAQERFLQQYARQHQGEAAVAEIAMSSVAAEELPVASRQTMIGAPQLQKTTRAVAVHSSLRGCPAAILPQHSAPSGAAATDAVRCRAVAVS